MKPLRHRILFALCAALSAAQALSASPRVNDFTKAARDADREFKTDPWRNANKSVSSDLMKNRDMPAFTRANKESAWDGKQAVFREGLSADRLTEKTNRFSDRSFTDIPDYSAQMDKVWSKSSNKPHFRNADKDLNKDYLGKIDVDARSDYDKQAKEVLEHVQENSLREINKFFSLQKESGRDDIPITAAGSKLSKSEAGESFLDAIGLGSSTDVGRPKMSLRKNADLSSYKSKSGRPSDGESGYENNTSRQEPIDLRDPNRNDYSPVPLEQPAAPQKRVVEKKVDTSNNKGTFFGLPKEYRKDDATIKVQVGTQKR